MEQFPQIPFQGKGGPLEERKSGCDKKFEDQTPLFWRGSLYFILPTSSYHEEVQEVQI